MALFKEMLEQIRDAAVAEKQAAGQQYWTDCPQCGKRVVTEELQKNGCYVCGYRPRPGE